MTKFQPIRILTTGGMVSPGDLRKLVSTAYTFGCSAIELGSRQEIYLQVNEGYHKEAMSRFKQSDYAVEPISSSLQNIVTSFTAIDIFPSTPWLLAGTYFEVLEGFSYKPTLKINITDPLQGLVPLFSGNLNFVASTYPNYWYLYLSLPGSSQRQLWPVLVESTDIATLSKKIEEVYDKNTSSNSQELFNSISETFSGKSRKMDRELQLTNPRLPYYEGLNKAGNSYWLGIYRRNYEFPIPFIDELCMLCSKTKIGKISITPWKSFIIKDIKEEDRKSWEKLLGKYGINIRHSSLELNWQLPDLDRRAQQLKDSLVRAFDKKDIRTSGLSFALKTSSLDVATSVIIEEKPTFTLFGKYPLLPTYTIYHTPDFSNTHPSYVLYEENVVRKDLATILKTLCASYYENAGEGKVIKKAEQPKDSSQNHQIYQCKHCFTTYDQAYGDMEAGIAAGIAFKDLPPTYCCSLCEAPKTDYQVVIQGEEISKE